MTQLSSDNRQLRETVEKDRLQIKVLQKELQDLKKEVKFVEEHTKFTPIYQFFLT